MHNIGFCMIVRKENRKGAILMKSKKKIGLIGGIAAIAVILCIAAVMIVTRNGEKEDYRDISVFDLSASATVTRDGTTLDAYSGMKLMSGDDVKVGDDGYICLLLDGDKYVTLETGTEIRLNASGNKENSKTTIELVQGAVLNELDSKLNNDSSYELSTPVSVMAVRGTVFRVALKSEGEANTADVMVFDGKVAAAAVLADGTVSSEENMVAAGKAANFHKADANSDPEYTPAEISYEDLPADTLAAILKICESGRIPNLSVSKEDLQQLIKDKESGDSDDQQANSADDPASSDPASDPSAADTTEPDEDADSADDDGNTNSSEEDDDYSDSDSDSDDGTVTNQGTPSDSKADTKTDKKSGKKSDSKSDKKSDKKSTKKPDNKKKPNTTSVPKPVPQSTSDPANQTPSTSSPNSGNTTYTVTFVDPLGRVFGTQSIASGSQAQKPALSPAGGTNWCDAEGNVFNFNTAITSDLTLYYR
ncbi:MAG: hypothetical protein HFG32_02530 [Eubacterium sp.]|nr:hypothetical protein [Eubacterium sp.]